MRSKMDDSFEEDLDYLDDDIDGLSLDDEEY